MRDFFLDLTANSEAVAKIAEPAVLALSLSGIALRFRMNSSPVIDSPALISILDREALKPVLP